jgi:prepilin-type N-terminal cleavage/methylation domain-containing protein
MITKSSGFSLIELLVVVAIIGIISSIGTLSYLGYTSGAKKKSAENIAQQLALYQSELYANTGEYYIQEPSDTSCTASKDSTEAVELNLVDGDNIIPDEVSFWVCTYGSASDYTISAQQYDSAETLTGCIINVPRNGSPVRINC